MVESVNQCLADWIRNEPDVVAAMVLPKDAADFQLCVRRFLTSTMDSARVYYANRCSQALLKKEDVDDAVHFRDGVLRKEMHGRIAYAKQRDHTAHTLNNYLLGWWIFEESGLVRDAFSEAFQARSGRKIASPKTMRSRFNAVWIWASLLHDVGYLLEGGA